METQASTIPPVAMPRADTRKPPSPFLPVLFAGIGVAMLGAAFRPKQANLAPTTASAQAVPASPEASEPPPPERKKPIFRVSRWGGEGVEVLETTLGRRSLLRALVSMGVTKEDAWRLSRAVFSARKRSRVGAKEGLVVARDRESKNLLGFELIASPGEVWQARIDDGPISLEKLPLAVEKRRILSGVSVEGGLEASLVRAGLGGESFTDLLDEALQGHADPSQLRSGARLRMVVSEERVEGEHARYTGLEAVELLLLNKSPLRVYGYERRPGKYGYYNQRGEQPLRGDFRAPIPLARISSRFNPKRLHPVLHVVMPHNGVDFAAGTGTRVFATREGTVVRAEDAGPCGNMVEVQHAGGLSSIYCHLSRFAPGLRRGQHIEARQLLGFVGQTGRVTGPHLHFGMKRGDRFVDPMGLRLDTVRVLSGADARTFQKKREECDALLDGIELPDEVEASDPAEETETVYEEPP